MVSATSLPQFKIGQARNTVTKWVYFFGAGKAEGHGSQRALLGGKGAGLFEMSRIGLPVPPGFTVTTDVCRAYYERRAQKGLTRAATRQPERSTHALSRELLAEFVACVRKLERATSRSFGDAKSPLLVSVRSGS